MKKVTADSGYRKFRADYLFDGFQLVEEASVLITAGDGTVREIVPEADAGEDLEAFHGMLSPGFVNCHCHLELSHMKGLIPEKTGLVDFVLSVVGRRQLDEELIPAAIEAAETAMLSEGIVCVGDICNTLNSIPQKNKKRLAYYNFIELSGWQPALAASRFEAGLKLYHSLKEPDAEHCSLSPHAPYSVSEDLWTLLIPHFKTRTISMHNQESPIEDELFRAGKGALTGMYERMKISNPSFVPSGKSSLETCLPKLKTARKILLVHNTFTKKEDLQAMKASREQVFICLCPNANLYIENALPPVDLLRSEKCRMVLGTDSLASNRQLSMMEEMKTILRHFPGIATPELLSWATSNGAEALQYEHRLGSFRPGKKPGVVLIDGLEGSSITGSSRATRII
jgi:aminodeoxyfutalosine deaminase